MAIFIPIPPWRRDQSASPFSGKANPAPTDTKSAAALISGRRCLVISTLQAVAWLSSMMV
jgi:hypothetical protein